MKPASSQQQRARKQRALSSEANMLSAVHQRDSKTNNIIKKGDGMNVWL